MGWIAAGGAVGAVARYMVMVGVARLWGSAFPWGTLTVNVVGSFVLGALIEILALVWSPGEGVRALLVVGMLGAFTTFSTFSLDVVTLYERGALAAAAAYIIASVVLSVAALFAGLWVVRTALS
ncbi:MAG: fluoride efflux transporter CrcB [Alphaproteobacteria bacterium]|nr:fluoride efflux transporter CrcB [Alphaproteobacteria bacterium]